MTEKGGGGILSERLGELLAEARAVGAVDEIRPLLERFLADAASISEPAEREGPRHGEMVGGMVGESASMREVFALIERVAPSEVGVLIEGETGTGKELVARALHDGSSRRAKTLLAVNCAAIPAGLLESELFGHVRGAFTDAVGDREGHFAAASGGTLLLDEIGEMPPDLQAKLLRVLECGEVRPVGASVTRKVDVRVVASTNRDLAALVSERLFREDLFYRLNVVRIALPPLREREGDVALLARHFLTIEGARIGRTDIELTSEALDALILGSWPGNVRQLENEIRRLVALTRGKIRRCDLSPGIVGDV
jgi:transcriptional regulator with GAF, ATPase, and Fis domain